MKKRPELLPFLNEGKLEAGCDEAGRGPLAGPVFAAAVILPPGFSHPLLDDSKKMSGKNRDMLRNIIEDEAVSFSVIAVCPEEIDAINILNASIAGMQRAVMSLDQVPEYLLIDGNRFRPFSWIASLAGRASRIPPCPGRGHADRDTGNIRPDSVQLHRQRRCQIHTDCRGICPRQDTPGRIHEENSRRISGIRLGQEYGLSYAGTRRGHKEIRAFTLSPEKLPSERAGSDPVVSRRNPAGADVGLIIKCFYLCRHKTGITTHQ